MSFCCNNFQEVNHTVIDARYGLLQAAQDTVLKVLRPSLEKLATGWGDNNKPDVMAQTKTSVIQSLESFAQVLARKFPTHVNHQ